MKAVKAKCKNSRKKTDKPLQYNFSLFIFYEPACLQKSFNGGPLSIRIFSVDGQYGLIVSLRRWTLSRQVIDLNQEESDKVEWRTIMAIMCSDSANQVTAFAFVD